VGDERMRAVPSGPTSSELLSQFVAERAKPERPIGAIERLIMSELEPAHSGSLMYAPDPTSETLFVVTDSHELPPEDEDDEFSRLPTSPNLPRGPISEKPRAPAPPPPPVDAAVSIALVTAPPPMPSVPPPVPPMLPPLS